jgi:ribonucleoside-diphosphate reductase beta chain
MPDHVPRGAADANAEIARTFREDFRATGDPALQAGSIADIKLLDPRALYLLWERQQWQTQQIDFTQDRIDWHERMTEEERDERMYGLSTFFIGEQRVAAALAPLMQALPDEATRLFLCTQIADEARHVAFFDRFYSEVGILPSDSLEDRIAQTSRHLNPEFLMLLDETLASRGRRLWQEPGDLEAAVEFVTIYHVIVEGMLALTGGHFIIDYNERLGTLPGLVEGFTNVARDEHRHVAFGAWFLRDMARRDRRYADAMERTLAEVRPVADGVLEPKWTEGMSEEEAALHGVSVQDTRAFARQALSRRLKVIGLAAAAEPPPTFARRRGRRR